MITVLKILKRICQFLDENWCGVFEVLKITATDSSLILICSPNQWFSVSQTLKKTCSWQFSLSSYGSPGLCFLVFMEVLLYTPWLFHHKTAQTSRFSKVPLVLQRNISFVETFLPPFEKTYWAPSLWHATAHSWAITLQ
jgi:hypothetical protein